MEFPLTLRTVGEQRVATGAGFAAQLVEYFKYAVSTGIDHPALHKPDVDVHTCDPSPGEGKTRESQV